MNWSVQAQVYVHSLQLLLAAPTEISAVGFFFPLDRIYYLQWKLGQAAWYSGKVLKDTIPHNK